MFKLKLLTLLFLLTQSIKPQIENCKTESSTTCPECKEGFFPNQELTKCLECSKLVPHCSSCTNDRYCTECSGNLVLEEVTIEDPKTGAEITLKECHVRPFLRTIWGLLIIALGPVLVVSLVTLIIGCVCRRRQKIIDEKNKKKGKEIVGNVFLHNKVLNNSLNRPPRLSIAISKNDPLIQLQKLQEMKEDDEEQSQDNDKSEVSL